MPPAADDEVWVPVTLHLPLGFAKAFNPTSCTPMALLVGPFSIIMLAQTANTVLVPVLPFLVKDVGASAVAYGAIQSTLWTSQTLLAPVHGWLSDKCGRRPVIIFTLLVSAAGNAGLALSTTIGQMMAARVLCGFGFQITLFRSYFADTSPREKRTGSFGLIGVITSFSLFAGPSIGGLVSSVGGGRLAAWLASALCLLGAFVACLWHPAEKVFERSESTVGLTGEALAAHNESHKTVNGVKMVKIDLNDFSHARRGPGSASGGGPGSVSGGSDTGHSIGCHSASAGSAVSAHRGGYGCASWPLCRSLRKAWLFARWLAGYDLYPLLSLNFFFRFAFAAYKSNFAFFCMVAMGYGTKEVGYALSAMGLGGMLVQGVLVRVTVKACGEEKTLVLAMASTASGFALLSMAHNLLVLAPALTLIAIGYGLAVPCISTLFSHVPVEQGVMQGLAGAIDRFGQAFGPVVGGSLLAVLGEAELMRWTGYGLALVSAICLGFIGEGSVFLAFRELCCDSRPAPAYARGASGRDDDYDDIEIADLFLCCCGNDDDGRVAYRPVRTAEIDAEDVELYKSSELRPVSSQGSEEGLPGTASKAPRNGAPRNGGYVNGGRVAPVEARAPVNGVGRH